MNPQQSRRETSSRTSKARGPSHDRPTPIHRGSGGQHNADKAAEAAPGDRTPDEDLDERQDRLLDQAVEETFPASDPISPKRIT
jgi:hypothetical protein